MSAQALATALLLPPFLFVWGLLGAVGLALAPGRRRAPAAALLAALSALGLLALATPYAAGSLRAAVAGMDREPAAPAPGAIVILGGDGAPGGGDAPGPLSLERMRAGAALARATGLPVLVTGGPLSPGAARRPIAEIMAEGLRADFGVEARWVERRAPNTAANARLSAAMLRAAGVEGGAFVVTHAWHLPRARAAFAREGFPTAPAPVRAERWPEGALSDFAPRPDRWGESWLAIRELAGGVVARLGEGR